MSTDPFNTARSNFIGLGDLEGRAVLVMPTEVQTGIESTRPGGKPYDRVVADVIVLDGDPDEELDITELPYTVEGMFISGAVLVPQLRGALRSKRPVLGTVSKQKSRTKGNQDAVVLSGEVTEAQKALARKAWADYEKTQADPFETSNA